jgi:N-methylhydantoinase B/oxoprolinase/acetone carboxylase alpha subunit
MKHAATQSDMNMNFDGMESMKVSRSSKYQTNHWSGHSNDGRLVNKGRGPTVAGQTGHKTPGTVGGVPAVPKQGSVRDSINRGSQVRNPGGTTQVKCPPNPDKIRVGQSGGPGYGQTQKGSRPTTSASQSDFNYGPKSQY